MVTLNDHKAPSIMIRNICGMKKKKNVLKDFLLFLFIPTILHGFKD